MLSKVLKGLVSTVFSMGKPLDPSFLSSLAMQPLHFEAVVQSLICPFVVSQIYWWSYSFSRKILLLGYSFGITHNLQVHHITVSENLMTTLVVRKCIMLQRFLFICRPQNQELEFSASSFMKQGKHLTWKCQTQTMFSL